MTSRMQTRAVCLNVLVDYQALSNNYDINETYFPNELRYRLVVDERARNANLAILKLICYWIGSQCSCCSSAFERQCSFESTTQRASALQIRRRQFMFLEYMPYSTALAKSSREPTTGHLRRWWLVGCGAMHVDDKIMHDWLHSRACPLKGGCRVWRP